MLLPRRILVKERVLPLRRNLVKERVLPLRRNLVKERVLPLRRNLVKERVLPLRINLVKEKKGAWRRRIYRKYASCKWLKDTGLEFTRADVVVSISRGPPGQWFPETEYWASAIFVGTSGIPPKIIYRSVKSYRTKIINQGYIYRHIVDDNIIKTYIKWHLLYQHSESLLIWGGFMMRFFSKTILFGKLVVNFWLCSMEIFSYIYIIYSHGVSLLENILVNSFPFIIIQAFSIGFNLDLSRQEYH